MQRVPLARLACQLLQDLPAAVGLTAQECDIFCQWRSRLDVALQLTCYKDDGGERCTELMGCSSSEPIESMQFLLTREHQFGGGQRG